MLLRELVHWLCCCNMVFSMCSTVCVCVCVCMCMRVNISVRVCVYVPCIFNKIFLLQKLLKQTLWHHLLATTSKLVTMILRTSVFVRENIIWHHTINKMGKRAQSTTNASVRYIYIPHPGTTRENTYIPNIELRIEITLPTIMTKEMTTR